MKNYSESEYAILFKKFFAIGGLQGPHKCIFLHALTDIGLIDNDDLIGKEWISQDGPDVTLDLNFMAARFAKAYHGILGLDIKYSPARKNQPSILSTFKEYTGSDCPTLVYLASGEMKSFRNRIIRRDIIPEVLPNLVDQTNKEKPPDFPEMYARRRGTNTIVFKRSLINFMKSKRGYLRHELGKKLRNYLEELNPGKEISGTFVDPDNPFYQYVMGQQRLFLAGVRRDEGVGRFEKFVKAGVKLEHVAGVDSPVRVWGIRSTRGNKYVWEKIRRGDVILFSSNNQCFAKGMVLQTVQNADEAERLWGKDGEPARDLLIILENVAAMQFNLVDSHIRLAKPTMPDEYNFPITQVDEGLVSALVSAYHDVETAMENMSEPIEHDVHDVSVSLIVRKAKVRRGQGAFRAEVLKNYGKRCAVCGINKEDLLEASHILPVKYLESAGDIKNGICLCVLHHTMLDKRYMYFDTDYALKFTSKTPQYLQDTCTKMKITKTMCREMPSREHLESSSCLIRHQES